jgi:hypothetical protein
MPTRKMPKATGDNDTEGQGRRKPSLTGDDDSEGLRRRPSLTDDTEGHVRRVPKVTGDDDTEGHVRRVPKVTGDDDTEGQFMAPNPEMNRQFAKAREDEIRGNLKRRENTLEASRPHIKRGRP